MCGVGKFCEQWGLDARNECHRCGQPEDTLHALRCSCPLAAEAWSARALHLQSWMTAEMTAPTIANAILQFFQTIRGLAISIDQVGNHIHTSRPQPLACVIPNASLEPLSSQGSSFQTLGAPPAGPLPQPQQPLHRYLVGG
ncbi:unnamed protein product [Cylindrotheca closterium]|uniref:Uncharacterized protein n=1 Tax=Cylindrotheca closterium TaxID=2856 RepID=A0AAD2CCS1_9STRA|nr:unnamed protein product [Cylindrotheca closterium]